MAYKNPIELAKELQGKKTPINRDAYIKRLFDDPDRSYNENNTYNDDELRELAGYVFNQYGFDKHNEEDWDDPSKYGGYDEFRDHFLDNIGSLSHYRGLNGAPWKYPSSWDNMTAREKQDTYNNYWYSFTNSPQYRAGGLKQLIPLSDEINRRIKNEYKKKYGRNYTGSNVDDFIELFHRTPQDQLPGSLDGWSDEQIETLLKLAHKVGRW